MLLNGVRGWIVMLLKLFLTSCPKYSLPMRNCKFLWTCSKYSLHIRNPLFLMDVVVIKEAVGNALSLILIVKINLILACILMLVLEIYHSLRFGAYSLFGTIIETCVPMVLDTRLIVEDSFPYINMCDGTDIMLNKESLLFF